jgi:hypothetical protein
LSIFRSHPAHNRWLLASGYFLATVAVIALSAQEGVAHVLELYRARRYGRLSRTVSVPCWSASSFITAESAIQTLTRAHHSRATWQSQLRKRGERPATEDPPLAIIAPMVIITILDEKYTGVKM